MGEWIAVAERLPDTSRHGCSEWFLVTDGKGLAEAFYTLRGEHGPEWSTRHGKRPFFGPVTHYAECPQLPGSAATVNRQMGTCIAYLEQAMPIICSPPRCYSSSIDAPTQHSKLCISARAALAAARGNK